MAGFWLSLLCSIELTGLQEQLEVKAETTRAGYGA